MNEQREKRQSARPRISVRKNPETFLAAALFLLTCQRESSSSSVLLTTELISFFIRLTVFDQNRKCIRSANQSQHAVVLGVKTVLVFGAQYIVVYKVARWSRALGRMLYDVRNWHAHLLVLCILHGLPKRPCTMMMVEFTSEGEDGSC